MSVMTAAATNSPPPAGLPWGRPLTYDDLAGLPDDGHRYELIDGVLIVSPAPRHVHQRILGNLYLAVREHCPADLEVLFAPFEVVLAHDTVLQPDLIVARRSDLTERNLPTTPLLAVEVASPSTRRFDRTIKHSRLEAAGCRHYWIVDPDGPTITTWRLGPRGYGEPTRVEGSEPFTVDEPYPISFRPADLIT